MVKGHKLCPADRYYDSMACAYDRHRFKTKYARSVSNREIAFVVESVRPGARVIEFGCGTGRFTRALIDYGCLVTAVDSATEMLESTRRRVGSDTRLRLVHGRVQDAPRMINGQFDAVVSMRMLPHVEDKEEVLTVMRRFGEPDASYVVDSWNLLSFVGLSRVVLRRHGIVESYYLRRGEFLAMIARCGFDVVDELCWGFPRIGQYSLDQVGQAHAKQVAYSTVVRMIATDGV